jgi:hypothetical protein
MWLARWIKVMKTRLPKGPVVVGAQGFHLPEPTMTAVKLGDFLAALRLDLDLDREKGVGRETEL